MTHLTIVRAMLLCAPARAQVLIGYLLGEKLSTPDFMRAVRGKAWR